VILIILLTLSRLTGFAHTPKLVNAKAKTNWFLLKFFQ
jgi:hypothetical protein